VVVGAGRTGLFERERASFAKRMEGAKSPEFRELSGFIQDLTRI
jgi:hypothetical protein